MFNGIVPFNKPSGITSAELVYLVKTRLINLGLSKKN